MQENAGFIISTKIIQIKEHAPRHEKVKTLDKGPKSYITKENLREDQKGISGKKPKHWHFQEHL